MSFLQINDNFKFKTSKNKKVIDIMSKCFIIPNMHLKRFEKYYMLSEDCLQKNRFIEVKTF
jgi:hypothetical protein